MKTPSAEAVSINVLHTGAAPIALSLARLAGIREIVDQFTGWSPNNRSTSPGILAETLTAAILCGCRPLYKVEHFWEDKAIEVFYQGENITAQQLHDDAYARMLDKLASIDCRRMFETICLTMLQYHNLDIVLTTHSDTTSISVDGLYELEQARSPEDFNITYGHSKDHRPDLKQFKIGLSTQQEGLPLSGELLSGNKSDQVWNPQAVTELSSLMKERGYDNVVFLADCALISTESLSKLSRQGVQFISRLPETFSLAAELKEEAWNSDSWDNIGKLAAAATDKASVYRTWQTVRELDGEQLGFVVVHSSNLEERKKKTLCKEIERKKKELCQKIRNIKKAREIKRRLLFEACFWSTSTVSESSDSTLSSGKEEEIAYSGKDRPKRGTEPEVRISWHVEVQVGEMRESVVEHKRRLASTFVLIYKLLENKSGEEILRSYKNQDKVEQGFKFLKQPLNLGPVYTKKPERVEALGYIFLIVLLLAKYLEYRVRVSMTECGEVLKIGGQKVKRPTAKTILEYLAKMSVIFVSGQLMLPSNIPEDVANVIRWSGFDEQVYICGYSIDHFHKILPGK